MGLRHSLNHIQPWVRIWFQNLKKDYPEQDGKGKLVNVRGSITPRNHEHRWPGISYQFLIGRSHIALDTTCYGGDGHSDLQFHIAFLFFQLFFTIDNFFGFYPKKKDGNYWNPMNTGIRMDLETISVHVWYDCHESRSDGSTHIFSLYKWWPWSYDSANIWEVQRADGSFGPIEHEYSATRGDVDYSYKDQRLMHRAPYTYTLRSGEVQERIATFHVDRMVWYKRYQKWFKWAKWPCIDRTSISVNFNEEVGERSGSWKGGTTGCGYEMLPGEKPIDTLRRMERERKF